MKHAPKKVKWGEKTKMVRSHVCIFLRGETKTKKGARRWLEHECTWLYPQHRGWMGRQREPWPEGMEKMTLPSDWPPGDRQHSRTGSRGACRTRSQTGGRTFVPGHQLTQNKTEARSWGFREHWPVPQRERLTNVDRVSWPHGPRVMAGTGKTMRMQGGWKSNWVWSWGSFWLEGREATQVTSTDFKDSLKSDLTSFYFASLSLTIAPDGCMVFLGLGVCYHMAFVPCLSDNL